MSIAGDTQPRVPGFYSQPETILSPRKSGLAFQSAQLPGTLTQPTASGSAATAVGSGTASGSGAIAIGTGTASGTNSISLGNGSASATNAVAIGTGSAAGSTDNIAINSALSSGATQSLAIGLGTGSTLGNRNFIGIGINPSGSGADFVIGIGSASFGAAAATNFGNSNQGAIIIGFGSSVGSNQRSGIAIGSANLSSSPTFTSGASVGANFGISIGAGSSSNNVGSVALGVRCTTDNGSQFSYGAGDFNSVGTAITSLMKMWQTTTTNTATELGLASVQTDINSTTPTGRITCTNFSTYIFDVDIVARSVGSASVAAYNLKFAFNRNANAASSTISSLSKTILYTIGTVTGWDVTATADTTNGRPNISVTGAAATTINWVANVIMTKVATAS